MPLPVRTAAVALGSNLGDREATLRSAVVALRALPLTTLEHVSSFHATAPVGAGLTGEFLNAAAVLSTALAPADLLHHLLAIERAHARVRDPAQRYTPRTLDLDLLLVDQLVLQTPDLTLPHPRLRERAFVLAPLAEIAPDLIVPGTRDHPSASIRELLAALPKQP